MLLGKNVSIPRLYFIASVHTSAKKAGTLYIHTPSIYILSYSSHFLSSPKTYKTTTEPSLNERKSNRKKEEGGRDREERGKKEGQTDR